ncbi:MAG: MutS-related protein [bacterium]
MDEQEIIEFSKNFSLLWPANIDPTDYQDQEKLTRKCVDNLGLKQIARELCYNDKHYYDVRKLLVNLCDEPQVIQYRLDIMEDFLDHPKLIEGFEEIFELIDKIQKYEKPESKMENDRLVNTAWRLKMLDIYAECMEKIDDLFSGIEDLNSRGLNELYNFVQEIITSELFQSLQKKLPELKEQFDQLSSVTIGINLNAQLKPEEAVFLSIEPEKYQKQSFFSRLFNTESNRDEFQGVSGVQNILTKDNEYKNVRQGIFKELNEIFEKVLIPIGKAISRYVHYREKFLLNMKRELYFYIGASRTIKNLKQLGLKMCKPEPLAASERITRIQDLTDLTLALGLIEDKKREKEKKDVSLEELDLDLGAEIVPNDITFDDRGRIFILTGPNQGGKTTFTRAVGIAQVLFQAGLYIPGSRAQISPANRVYTHFTEKEEPNTRDGRLGKESRRLSRLIRESTRNSLILMNESLSSTSPGESLYLLKNIVKGLRIMGCRVILTTHLHTLAQNIEEINSEVEGDSKVRSLVAEVDRNTEDENIRARRTFKIVPKPPEGKSYARDIAYKYGISLEQIMEKID